MSAGLKQLFLGALVLSLLACGYDPNETPTVPPPTPTPTATPLPPTPTQPPTPTRCPDQDEDGSCDPDDCNDRDDQIFPSAAEACDGEDSNCDGQVDPSELDLDSDGQLACDLDCDDSDPDVGEDFDELCDGLDNDCSGEPGKDEADSDLDGYLNCQETAAGCNAYDPSIHPNAEELCDGVDNNCDGQADNNPDFDLDQDGALNCGLDSSLLDCKDSDAEVRPGAQELCDAKDNDCDTLIDEGFDVDGDGFTVCGSASQSPDCNDALSSINPDEKEVCDSANQDEDCDGVADDDDVEPQNRIEVYQDADGDLYGSPDVSVLACDVPEGYVSNPDDCDDSSSEVHPGAPESCDGVDTNCDGSPLTSGNVSTEGDTDGDGWLDCREPASDCAHDPARNPAAEEICDGLDNDCDSNTDEGFDNEGNVDSDNDGKKNCLDNCPVWVETGADPSVADGGYNTPWTSIQQGIDLTLPSTCAIVAVRAGTYYERLDFKGKGLQVIGWDSSGLNKSVTLDAGGQGPAVVFQSVETAASQLRGFRITNGAGATCGGGVLISSASPTLRDNLIEYNSASYGAGICIEGGQPLIGQANTIRYNDATVAGGGVYLTDQTGANLTTDNQDLSISYNSAPMGAGIYCDSYEDGPGYGTTSYVKVESNATNSGGRGGGLYLAPGCKGSFYGYTLQYNAASKGHGGGVYVDAGVDVSAVLGGGTLKSNEAEFGGAIAVSGSAGLQVSESILFDSNVARLGGGAVWLDSGSALTLRLGRFTSNRSDQDGGALYVTRSAAATLEGCDFNNNRAGTHGGALYATGPRDLDIRKYSGSTTTTYTTFTSNSATGLGGALFLNEVGSNGEILEVTFLSNSAATGGALANNSGSPVFKGNSIQKNTAASGGGTYCSNTPVITITGVAPINTLSGNSSPANVGCTCNQQGCN